MGNIKKSAKALAGFLLYYSGYYWWQWPANCNANNFIEEF